MSNKLDWNHSESIREYIHLLNDLGPPTVKSTRPGGIAIWTKDDLSSKIFYGSSNCFDEIMLRDEAIQHNNPVSHFDCLYVSIKVSIPKNKLKLIESCDIVFYDRMKNLLTARCNNIRACILILYVITKLLLNEIKETEIIEYHRNLLNDIQNSNLMAQIYADLVNNKITLDTKQEETILSNDLLGGTKKKSNKKSNKKSSKKASKKVSKKKLSKKASKKLSKSKNVKVGKKKTNK